MVFSKNSAAAGSDGDFDAWRSSSPGDAKAREATARPTRQAVANRPVRQRASDPRLIRSSPVGWRISNIGLILLAEGR